MKLIEYLKEKLKKRKKSKSDMINSQICEISVILRNVLGTNPCLKQSSKKILPDLK